MASQGEGVEGFKKLLEALSERGELTPGELKDLTGLGEQEVNTAISVLEALGLVEVEEGTVRWLEPEVKGKVIIVRGKVDYVIHNPFEVRVFGQTELRATAKPA